MKILTRVSRPGALLALAASAQALAAPIPGEEPVRMPLDELLAHDRFADAEFGVVTRIEGLELPTGESVTLNVERFNVRAPGAQFIAVDGAGNENPIADNGVRLFQGSVQGDPDSMVFLASSPYFTHGYIQDAKNLYAISSGAAVVGPGAPANPVEIVDVNTLDFRHEAPFPCGSDPAFENFPELAANIVLEGDYPPADVREDVCRVVNIAIDTDYEYTSRLFGGNTNASSAYAETLLGAISTIYERDVDTNLVTGYVRVFAANNDPYTDSGDALSQVSTHWQITKGGIERQLVHYLSGRRNLPYGGVAYLSALCDPNQGYGVSAFLNGSFPQPLTDNVGGNWDVVVMAHELGHNHGTGHTHDSYVPVIDGCGNGDCSLAADGTIMSYCHTCSGGISNIRLGFHPRVRAVINSYLGNLPNCDIINPDWTPDALAVDDSAQTFDGIKIAIDVLANDTRGSCSGYRPSIGSHNSFSANGGLITKNKLPMSQAQGLFYTPPADFTGTDTFTYTNSWGEPATVTVQVTGFRPPEQPAFLVGGVTVEYFAFDESLSQIPDLAGLTPDYTEQVSVIDYPLTSGDFSGSGLTDRFAVRVSGYFDAPLKTNYTFFLDSDDGSRFVIGDDLVVIDHDGLHGYTELAGDAPLDEGPHAFTLEYFDNDGDAGLTLSYSALGSPKTLAGPELKSVPNPEDCPADITGDGILDNGDIGAFVSAFLAGDPATDFTGDGILDNGDIGAFVVAFLAGC
ncbi:MAG: M12 family metallo-peptidase [Phycisphaerales bacterium JB040]